MREERPWRKNHGNRLLWFAGWVTGSIGVGLTVDIATLEIGRSVSWRILEPFLIYLILIFPVSVVALVRGFIWKRYVGAYILVVVTVAVWAIFLFAAEI